MHCMCKHWINETFCYLIFKSLTEADLMGYLPCIVQDIFIVLLKSTSYAWAVSNCTDRTLVLNFETVYNMTEFVTF